MPAIHHDRQGENDYYQREMIINREPSVHVLHVHVGFILPPKNMPVNGLAMLNWP